MRKNKVTDQEYHVRNMRSLINYGKKLLRIPGFPTKDFYQRDDEKGWWMPTKQFAIKSYCQLYLEILQKQQFIDTIFIDPLSSNGMVRLSKKKGEDILLMPGTSINAALVSLKKEKGFSEFFINDISPENREIMSKRFEAFNQINNNALSINIEPKERGKIDSNEWILDILDRIKDKYEYPNYLMVIDNQGMDIGYETLKKIREYHEFGDIIITFHDSAFSRAIHSDKIEFFYGRNLGNNTTIEIRRNLYIKQLKLIGFGRIEPLFIRSDYNFFYTLLFCCRKDVPAKWLDMIKYFRKVRFRNCTAVFMKNVYDIAKRKVKPLNKFC
ncbi:MAG: hypothetical protein ACFFDH_15320 [Promethearchaeota archaeon]